jgi:O-antigen/teichoic acid export membrane protein
MYFSIFGAILTIVLNVVFIPTYGFMASAWATLIAYGGMAIISYIYGKKYYRVPYKIRKIIFYILVSTLFSFLSFYQFRDMYFVSILMIALFIGLIIFLEKDELKTLLKHESSNNQ